MRVELEEKNNEFEAPWQPHENYTVSKKTCLTGKQVVGVKAVGSVVNTHWILNSNYMSEHTTLTLCQVEAENIVQRK